MKKWIALFLSSVMVLTLAACGSQQQTPAEGVIERPQQTETPTETPETEVPADSETEAADSEGNEAEQTSSSSILIAYFTVPETDGIDTVSSASRVLTGDGVMGNTQFIATEIQKNLWTIPRKTDKEKSGLYPEKRTKKKETSCCRMKKNCNRRFCHGKNVYKSGDAVGGSIETKGERRNKPANC